MSPIAQANGHDAPRLVTQTVPSVATQIDDLLVGLEDAVGEEVVPQELPDILDGVQFGRFWGQRQDGDVFGYAQFCGRMPTGLIGDEDGMRTRIDGGANNRQMGVHRLGVAPGKNKADAFALLRAYGAEDIGPLGALIAWRAGPCSTLGPASCNLVLLADPRLVLEPKFDLYARIEARADRLQLGGEVFLKASTANSFCAW